MADRRMFSKKITDSDAFIGLSASAQALYFHLNQAADDDGFNNQIQIAMMKAHASNDDLVALLGKSFIIRFESGVIVIKHWRLHNTLRHDRYTPTNYKEELSLLGIKDNGAYTLTVADRLPNGCQTVAERLPDGCQVVAKRLPSGCQTVAAGKDRLVKDSKDKYIYPGKEDICRVVDYLNSKLNTTYKATTDKTKKLITARYNDGFKYEDFVSVIDTKYEQWHTDERMRKYLRPETLFGTKFESYLNERTERYGRPRKDTVTDYTPVTDEYCDFDNM